MKKHHIIGQATRYQIAQHVQMKENLAQHVDVGSRDVEHLDTVVLMRSCGTGGHQCDLHALLAQFARRIHPGG